MYLGVQLLGYMENYLKLTDDHLEAEKFQDLVKELYNLCLGVCEGSLVLQTEDVDAIREKTAGWYAELVEDISLDQGQI